MQGDSVQWQIHQTQLQPLKLSTALFISPPLNSRNNWHSVLFKQTIFILFLRKIVQVLQIQVNITSFPNAVTHSGITGTRGPWCLHPPQFCQTFPNNLAAIKHLGVWSSSHQALEANFILTYINTTRSCNQHFQHLTARPFNLCGEIF